MTEEADNSEKYIQRVRDKGFDRAAQRAATTVAKMHRRAMREFVFGYYTMINDLLEAVPEQLPKWMVKDLDGAIMIYPGTPVHPGYALRGREIFRVPSVLGYEQGKDRVGSREFGVVFNKIVSYWEDKAPTNPKA